MGSIDRDSMRYKVFWLHIKKAAGISTRESLGPLYKEVDRRNMPSCFISRPRDEWNDILNNYRVPLGSYHFRRSDFAKEFLYKDEWSEMATVAFSREPIDRALSMYYYLFSPFKRNESFIRKVKSIISSSISSRKLLISESYALSAFLDLLDIQKDLREKSIYEPAGLHFSTHTNPMSLDVGFQDGGTNMSHIFRLDNYEKGIEFCYSFSGVERPQYARCIIRNRSNRKDFTLTKEQICKIQDLYREDFTIYENAL